MRAKTSRALLAAATLPLFGAAPTVQPRLGTRGAPILEVQGLRFRDLNRSGALEPYEDWRLAPEARAADLVARMSVEEKVGAMMHSTLPGLGGPLGRSAQGYDFEALRHLIAGKHVTSFITRLALPADRLADQNNRVQALSEATRLGIPVSISSDPRHHFRHVLGASEAGGGFSQWPETLGLAAIGDPALVRRFGDVARREYRAVGIHVALSPQADLATEPRWPRIDGTFGGDPEAVSRLAGAYVEGFQKGAGGLGPESVAAVVKHWVGYGAAPQGYDAHNHYGRIARLTDRSFAAHVRAFEGSLAAGAAGVMPAYPILEGLTLDGEPIEPVAPGFSAQLLQGLLRGRHGFDGLILSDWAITRDCDAACVAPTAEAPQQPRSIATPWGVETLSNRQRFVKGVLAGLDQFGGTDEVEHLLAAVKEGEVSESRLDASVRRVLRQKLQLGLFEDPYVDPQEALLVVGAPELQKEADAAQRRAQVVLENRGVLPLAPSGKKVFLHKVDPALAARYGFTVVTDPAAAEVALIRTEAPFERLHPHHFFGSRQHEGRLDFRDGDPDYEVIKSASRRVPTVVSISLDRPAILTNLREKAAAILANFGASDPALLDVVTGRARAEGRLPFELPSSMEAVEAQAPDLPDDSRDPLYPRGYRFDR